MENISKNFYSSIITYWALPEILVGWSGVHLTMVRWQAIATPQSQTHIPHPLLSQSVFTEFTDLMGLFLIRRARKPVLRSQNQNTQKAKIRSVTLQGAESGLKL
ncbi:hypothetical protein H6F61_19850 [Cyanobacteria bacterium FACHB-472]|nr:hypothetical protein [Cyanobacteria bacterium FACHB-472]